MRCVNLQGTFRCTKIIQKRIYSLINKEVISVLCAISGRFVTWKKDYVTWLHSDIRRMSLPLLLLSSEERNVKTAL